MPKMNDNVKPNSLELTSNSIRNQFINFFTKKKHHFIPSAPLAPKGDNTLLFINSGMAQFKDIFLGSEKPKTMRATNSQKCIRLSGKHNDLEEVGFDTYHHTFFEMLGSWSFGDYYKKEAIGWAWELLCDVWKLPKEKLYATVYKTDHEAATLWKSETDIDPASVLYFDENDNFWEMAETGPCGPCSEIHIDIGEENCSCKTEAEKTKCKQPGGGVNTGCGRYIEIWNLVFIQFYREPNGELTPLTKKYVDTGMGFERIVAVMQNKNSNYDTDVFTPIIQKIEALSGVRYAELTEQRKNESVAFRVVADHLRAVSFSIADGVLPSNEGRGYVVRRLIRRAVRYGRNLQLMKPFLHGLVETLVKQMGNHYDELVQKESEIAETILREEKLFASTLDKGLTRLGNAIAAAKETGAEELSGAVAFELYDTFGFPYDLTVLIASENSLDCNEGEFEAEMSKQKKRSRLDNQQKKSSLEEMARTVLDSNTPTHYIGETVEFLLPSPLRTNNPSTNNETTVIALFNQDEKPVNNITTGEGTAVLNLSAFYGEGGGQVGDAGNLANKTSNEIVATVLDTKKSSGVYFLKINVIKPLQVGMQITQQVNLTRKQQIRKNHTAAHLLMQGLVDVLGSGINQAGSFLNEEKVRFDFTHTAPVNTSQLQQIEALVNEKVQENIAVTTEEMPKDEALKKGARAFFEEKYGDTVRVVSIGDYSIELCGGSHVMNTNEIGAFTITTETSVAAGVRRIEATTSSGYVQKFNRQKELIKGALKALQLSNESELLEKIKAMKNDLGEANKRLASLSLSEIKKTLSNSIKKIDSSAVLLTALLQGVSAKIIREAIETCLRQHEKAIAVVACNNNDKPSLFLAATATVAKKLNLPNLAATAGTALQGSGGGKTTFAQAGGKNAATLKNEYEKIIKIITTTF